MSAKNIIFQQEAREKIRSGVAKLAKAVKATLGPRGRNAIIEKTWGSPTITKDGVTVAKEVELKDQFENLGAQMVKQVASKTSDVAGDGTTTATVLAEAIFEEGMKVVAAGANIIAVKNGIQKAIDAVIEELIEKHTKIDPSSMEAIAQVGMIAANNDPKIGKILADALEKVGKDGVITVDEGRTFETEIDLIEGMELARGYASAYMVTDRQSMKTNFENAMVLVTDHKLSTIKDIEETMNQAVLSGKGRPLLIIATEVDGDALTMLVMNHLQGGLKAVAVKAPGFGDNRDDILGDIAALTGAKLISSKLGHELAKVKASDFGSVDSVVATKDRTTLLGGGGSTEDIQARIAQIEAQLAECESEYDQEKMLERKSKLAGGVAQIKVGGATEAEVKELKARVEDALHATRAALEEGIVPGGGVALLRCASALDKVEASEDEKVGVGIVRRALEAPIRQIAENSGVHGAVVIERVRAQDVFSYGYNAACGEYCDLVEVGVVDPTKVTRTALQNAGSIASLLLTTDVMIADIPEEKPDPTKPMGGMGM